MAGGPSVTVRWALGAAIVAVALAAAVHFLRPRRAPTVAQPPRPVASVSAATSSSARPRPPPFRPSRALVWPFEDPGEHPSVVPLKTNPADEEARIRALPPDQRRAERDRRMHAATVEHLGYPPFCRPAAEAPSRVLPHHVAPVVRPLEPAPFELGHALVRSVQDRDHLLPGETAALTVEVAIDGKRAPFEVKSAELLQMPTVPGAAPESAGVVAFHDDGKAPDKAAGDGVSTARVAVPAKLHDFEGELTVRADVSTASETGRIFFPIVAAGPAPAEFTGSVREAVEDGSLAFYAGIRVRRPGRYAFTGRVYASEHRALAVLATNGNFDGSSREVRLALCGKLIREGNVGGPWELRDVEGFLLGEIGGHPDRVPMPLWAGPHRTKEYPLDTFAERP